MEKALMGGKSTKKTNRPIVLASIMLAMFMGAIEATIVSTAMPAIVGDLGGFSLYSWVFSVVFINEFCNRLNLWEAIRFVW